MRLRGNEDDRISGCQASDGEMSNGVVKESFLLVELDDVIVGCRLPEERLASGLPLGRQGSDSFVRFLARFEDAKACRHVDHWLFSGT